MAYIVPVPGTLEPTSVILGLNCDPLVGFYGATGADPEGPGGPDTLPPWQREKV